MNISMSHPTYWLTTVGTTWSGWPLWGAPENTWLDNEWMPPGSNVNYRGYQVNLTIPEEVPEAEANWYIRYYQFHPSTYYASLAIWKKRGTLVTETPFGLYDLVFVSPSYELYQYGNRLVLRVVSTILKFTVSYDVEFPLISGGTVTTTIDILCEGIVPINIYNITWPTPWSSAAFTPRMIQPNETITISETVTLPPEAQEQRSEYGLVLIEADVSTFNVNVYVRNFNS
jgi:hypothetical protein